MKNKLLFLIISNGENRKGKSKGRWHYLAVKKLPRLLRETTSKNNSEFYCLNCLHSLRTKNKLESHKRVQENKDFCNVILPSENTKTLEFNQYPKSDKAPFIIYAYLECLIENINVCKNNPEISLTTKVSEHIPSGLTISAIFSFRIIESKHDVYRGKDCIKKFCEFLR